MTIQSFLDTFADYRYRWAKRRLESQLITAAIREQTKKAARLQAKLSRLRYDRMAYLSSRITRNCKLTLVKNG